ncbi:MAG: multicopper oxidase domain-containing protein [Actinomycetota bacterium]|nr:multicopper oxidase domain-containing protein [Actinomycetota bacterium]
MTLHTSGRFAQRTSHGPTRRVMLTGIAVAALVAATAQATPAAARGSSAAHAGQPEAAASVRALQSAPSGKLTARGCTAGAGSASCDLYAMTGTASVLGASIPIWGFSTTGTAGSATAPGPLLVVHQGDAVSITLHNQLAGQTVSLALPSQAATAFAGSAGDDLTGVATNLSRSYSFTAARPGTFLYEAGHTANGARQVAMGLAGALVVLPADGTAYGTQSGMPSTAYDDEAVLVLSEIDPVLNASPATFDMRNFAPKYRLINGKAFPSTDPVSTDQAHTVLLRYVNAGSQMHAMSVLGGNQVEIAQDAHPMKFTTTVTAESIEPGQSLDTTVTMPTGPESKLALYERAGHLDNNGQTNGDPLQLAFGGMLTFLDTNAPAPSTDGVGPVSSHIAVSPSPSDGLSNVLVTADLSDVTTGGSAVTQAEFVVDDAVSTGVGFGVAMAGSFGSTTVSGVTGTIPVVPAGGAPCVPATGPAPVALSCLDAGKHTVFVRGLDAAGNWGVVGSVILNLPKTGPQTTNGSVESPANGKSDVALSATGDDSAAGLKITAAEYFVDTVGANGGGTAMSLNRSATIVSEDAVLHAADVLALPEGVHHLYVHSKDTLNLWGPPLDVPFTVDITGPTVDAASVGPNPSNGILTDHSNPGYLVISASITDKDAGGAVQSPLVDAEAFLDPATATPTEGSGLQLIAVDGAMNSTAEAVYGLIPISQIKALTNGVHHVYVRGQDAAGNWGTLFAISLIVDKVAPALGALTANPNPTNGAADLTLSAPVTDASLISAAEYWLGSVDPGVGKGSSVPVSVVSGNVSVTVPLAGIAAGPQRFNLRVKDLAGNWSNAVNTTVTVVRPNLIFMNGFEVGEPAWSATTGTVTYTAQAALNGARGMQVTMPGNGNGARYLTDSTPTAETGYHVRFAFNPNTLVSGTAAAVTLFDARTAGNGAVFTLDYRVTASGRQVRTVLSRSGAGAVTGAWVTLTAGSHTLLMDWVSATAGSLKLSVDGTAKSTSTGNTSTLRVDTARLGVIAGYTTSTAGASFFDAFSSGRTTAP